MGTFVLFLIAVLLFYAAGTVAITIYLVLWLDELPHERYRRYHVYAVEKETRWHIPRRLLELYRDIKDVARTEREDQPEKESVKSIKLWLFAQGLPGLFAPLVQVLRDDESKNNP